MELASLLPMVLNHRHGPEQAEALIAAGEKATF